MNTNYQKYLNYAVEARYGIVAIAVVIVLLFIQQASSIVNMVLLAMFFTSISLTPLEWLKKQGVNSTISIILIIMVFLVVVSLTGIVIGSSANNFMVKLPFYNQKVVAMWQELSEWMKHYHLIEEGTDPVKDMQPGKILPIAGTFFAGFGNVMVESLIVFILFIFMIFEADTFGRKMAYISPDISGKIRMIITKLRRYMGIKFITSLATGIAITVALLIIGVDFPVLWGFLAFVLNFIPSIGSFIAAIPAVLLALVQLGPVGSIMTIFSYLIINIVIGNIVEPQMMGKNLGISPLVVFISMIFFGFILGPIGMLIATPLTIIIKIIFDSNPSTRSLGILLGDGSDLNRTEGNDFLPEE